MKHITESLDIEIYSSRLTDFYFNGLQAATMDIETTGLSSSRSKFILGGLLTFEDRRFCQYFAQTESEEAEALFKYMDELSRLDVIVTYNGRHFDMPFILSRYRQITGAEYTGHLPYNFDLYLLLNGHSPVKHFVPNLKQKTIENYMGLWTDRTDEIDGAQSVELYKEYERTQDSELGRRILLHNSDDVIQLARLLKITSKCDMHKGMYKCGFPVGDLTVSRINISRDFLEYEGVQRGNPVNYRCYDIDGYPAYVDFSRDSRSFIFKVPIIRQKGIAVIDLFASGIDYSPLLDYPSCSSGFLAIESNSTQNHMEINHFIKLFTGHAARIMGRN